MSLAGVLNSNINMLKQSLSQYFRLSGSYFRRKNYISNMRAQIESYIKGLLTVNKKLKIARYRVNHLKYRVYQMENIIENNNPTNSNSGKSLNLLR